jgi:hypothetical protein
MNSTMSVQQIEMGLSQRTKDKFQYGMAGFLIVTAVILAFISFIITLTVGAGVIAWGGLCMGTALTLIGGGMYFHNQLVTFETNTNKKMQEVTAQVDREISRINNHPNRYSKDKPSKEEEDYFNQEVAEG